MKKTIRLFTILFLCLFVSCSDDDSKQDDFLDVSANTLSFSADGEKQRFTIYSNTSWEINAGKDSWYEVSPLNGTGNMEITVETYKNTLEKVLSAELVITTSSKEETVSISQKAAPEKVSYLPLVTINTENKAPVVSKDEYINATIIIQSRDENGTIVEKLLEAETEIKGRGNSTWGMEKKPYRLKLNKSASVLDMPKNKHWVLLANYSDKTLIRNELAFEVSRRMGFAYTPRVQYVDVVLNSDAIGNYMLCEHIRIDENRVNIPELKPDDADITGGYLLEIDERRGEPEWFQVKEAKMDFCINRPEEIPANQKTYIANHIQKLEDALYGKLGTVTTELPKYLDLKSFIDYYLLNELSKNVDGNLRLSTFVYKNQGDDKVYFGPVWDYDIAFGNVDYGDCEKIPGWYARNAAWYQKFFSHSEYDKMVKERWAELRKGPLNDVDTYIDKLAKELQQSQKKNFQRWPILSKYVWPNAVVTGSYQGEIDYLKDWIKKRLAWMDQNLK